MRPNETVDCCEEGIKAASSPGAVPLSELTVYRKDLNARPRLQVVNLPANRWIWTRLRWHNVRSGGGNSMTKDVSKIPKFGCKSVRMVTVCIGETRLKRRDVSMNVVICRQRKIGWHLNSNSICNHARMPNPEVGKPILEFRF